MAPQNVNVAAGEAGGGAAVHIELVSWALDNVQHYLQHLRCTDPRCADIGWKGVHHVGFICQDLQKSREFYEGVLGAQPEPTCQLRQHYRVKLRWSDHQYGHLHAGLSINPERPDDRLDYGGGSHAVLAHSCASEFGRGPLLERGQLQPVTQEEAVRLLISALGNCRHVVLAGQRDDPPDGAAQPGPDGGPARARRQVGQSCFRLCCGCGLKLANKHVRLLLWRNTPTV